MTVVATNVEVPLAGTPFSEPIHKSKGTSEELSFIAKFKKMIEKTSSSSMERKSDSTPWGLSDIQADDETTHTNKIIVGGNTKMHYYY